MARALRLTTSVERVEKTADGFALTLSTARVRCSSLVVASGGKSIPKMGATGFGYDLAAQFGLRMVETRPGAGAADLRAEHAGAACAAGRRRGRCARFPAARRDLRGSDAVHPSRLSAARRSCRSRPIGARATRSRIAMLPGVGCVRGAARGRARATAGRRCRRCWPTILPKRLAQIDRRAARRRRQPGRPVGQAAPPRRRRRSTTGASSRPARKAIAPPR